MEHRDATRRKLTPRELAKLWGIDPHKVLQWIYSGQLRAINAATRPGGRPRFLIDVADLAAFEAARAVVPPLSAPPRRRRDLTVPEYV